MFLILLLTFVWAELPHNIVIDGDFSDWASVPSYSDPEDASDGSVLQDGVPDVHAPDNCRDISKMPPMHVTNSDVDILEYRFTHDSNNNFYAYIRAKGNISRTSNGPDSQAGRSYLQVAMDLDDDMNTGYCLCEGGYYPNMCGYDMHFELEMYNGSFNTAHYLLHAMRNYLDYERAYDQQLQGIVQFAPSGYKNYTEWVYYAANDPPSPNDRARCPDGPHQLPNGDFICFVADKTNGPFLGAMEYAFSDDDHILELKAPWVGFMKFPDGTPAVNYGQKITITMSLEVSQQYSIPANKWASDSVWPILGYVIEVNPNITSSASSSSSSTFTHAQTGGIAFGAFLLGVIVVVCLGYWRRRQQRKYDMLGDVIDTDGSVHLAEEGR